MKLTTNMPAAGEALSDEYRERHAYGWVRLMNFTNKCLGNVILQLKTCVLEMNN